MEITLFNAITTENVIAELEVESTKYDGLYVNMNNQEERRYVKDKASTIADIRKRLNRARIDLTKDYKQSVELEFKALDERLANANKPFDLLIDEHKAERAKILADEKARKDAVILAEEKERDHEFALLMDSQVMADKAQAELEAEQLELSRNQRALELAKEQLERQTKLDKQRAIDEENARLANREHVRSVNQSIVNELTSHGFTDKLAKLAVRLIVHNKLPNITIKY